MDTNGALDSSLLEQRVAVLGGGRTTYPFCVKYDNSLVQSRSKTWVLVARWEPPRPPTVVYSLYCMYIFLPSFLNILLLNLERFCASSQG